MNNKRVLICGISGQDGSLLAKFLIDKNYEIWGTSRDHNLTSFNNLERLGIRNKVNLISMNPNDFRSVYLSLNKVLPTELYFLAGQSSVGYSFEQPVETIESIVTGTLNILEASKMIQFPPKLYFAGSSEVFGDTKGQPADENTPFKPKSPYAIAKASAFWLVENYREAYSLYACTGILFNHESRFRPSRFVTKKIVEAAKRIASGSKEKLYLGNIDIVRDWGLAEEYVRAMWCMLQQDNPDDFVISTGKSYSLKEFIQKTFNKVGLNWEDYVIQSENLKRPNELSFSGGNSKKAENRLGWKSTSTLDDVIDDIMNL